MNNIIKEQGFNNVESVVSYLQETNMKAITFYGMNNKPVVKVDVNGVVSTDLIDNKQDNNNDNKQDNYLATIKDIKDALDNL
jgi:hypothetical protein